ncbi:MAG: DUF5009 domain-containing protein, partial [Bacteroidales bacterium]|nr:DUF5009 domain-containing protein [Bacteroidales bacterium]
IFPLFLFIVGMSIPYAIENRFSKGDSYLKVTFHVFVRFVALLIMGLFTANLAAGVDPAIGMTKPIFAILTVSCFFLVWNVYPKTEGKKRWLFYALQFIGVVALIYLAYIYRDSKGAVFHIRWHILGSIGWAYIICALVYLLARHRLKYHILAWIAIVALSMATAQGLLGSFGKLLPGRWNLQAFTMSGVVLSLLFSKYSSTVSIKKFLPAIFGLGGVILVIGLFVLRRFWIISKLSNTPTWLFVCVGIAVMFYALLYWLVDIKGKKSWFKAISPAGSATLTCYFTPHYLYAIFTLTGLTFPAWMIAAPQGLLKCLAFAFLTMGMTALMVKMKLKLRI